MTVSSDAHSPGRSLLGWLDQPAVERGIHFGGPGDRWDFHSYDRLAALARRAAGGVMALGVGPGDVVVLIHRGGPDFVAAFFGVLLAGATPCPAAPQMAFQNEDEYAGHLRRVLQVSEPCLLASEADLGPGLGKIAAADGVSATTIEHLIDDGAQASGSPPQAPADLALLQLTSGSGGHAKGVRVPLAALEATVAAIGAWLGHTEHDATASWLPIYHDMGLIGCLLTPIAHTADIWLLPPREFVRRPLRYLRCFAEQGARLSAMPTFGVHQVNGRVLPEEIADLDFSGWRTLIVGAERIDAAALERFCALLEPQGFSRRALLPAYGLAEATLVVSGLPLTEEWRSLRVDPSTLVPGARIAEVEAVGEPAQAVVGCGPALQGAAVQVVDDAGVALPDRHVGEIAVNGRLMAEGYAAPGVPSSLTRWRDGTLYTGDAGFLADGELFVLGRLGDSVKIRGRALFAEDLEALLAERGIPAHRVVVVLGTDAAGPRAVVLLERAAADWLPIAERALRPRLETCGLSVLDVPRGVIKRTSSGKPKRRALWRALLAGELQQLAAPQGGPADAGQGDAGPAEAGPERRRAAAPHRTR